MKCLCHLCVPYILVEPDCTIHVAKTKALISCTVTAQLICVFVYAYAKSQFSHDAAYLTKRIHHPYHLDDPTSVFRGIRDNCSFFISFFDNIHVSKQNSPRWDAALCADPGPHHRYRPIHRTNLTSPLIILACPCF